MDLRLSELLTLLRSATGPEEVFGELDGDAATTLKRRYRELVTLTHPDHNPAQARLAAEAFGLLQQWYTTAQEHLAQGVYGARPQLQATTRQRQYTGYTTDLRGDLCDLFSAEADGAPVLLKAARNPRNNDLLQAEVRALRRLERATEGQVVRAHFPTLVEHFVLRDAAGCQRQVNVLRRERGTATLAEVLRAYPQGLDPRDAAWMFNRILAALGVAHGQGLVHGAVTPEHVLIRPSDHNGVLIDWCYSVPLGEPVPAICKPYADDYPPEVLAKQPAAPATDLYMAARCMLRLLGAGGGPARLPAHVPAPLAALLRACLIPAPQRRPADAWELFDDFQALQQRLYGPRTFRPFDIPIRP